LLFVFGSIERSIPVNAVLLVGLRWTASTTATRVPILVHDLNGRIINVATGELLRERILGPTRDYQPTGAPTGRKRKKPRT
jgi:hypothetical protein